MSAIATNIVVKWHQDKVTNKRQTIDGYEIFIGESSFTVYPMEKITAIILTQYKTVLTE